MARSTDRPRRPTRPERKSPPTRPERPSRARVPLDDDSIAQLVQDSTESLVPATYPADVPEPLSPAAALGLLEELLAAPSATSLPEPPERLAPLPPPPPPLPVDRRSEQAYEALEQLFRRSA